MAGEISDGDEGARPPELRFLRALVTALAVTMILGMTAIVVLLWLRLGSAPLPQLPEQITLPPGTSVGAVTFAPDWIVVVTDKGEVLLYDRAGGLRQRVAPSSPAGG
ncbi:DUF6476 family protein [Paracoccus pacificus]|uniref:DUF6476 family protein n=1 Tax=Paracoccus pacificus TaxID=1463598 RepID=A0ABW4RAD1_9RHOB